MGRNSLDAMLIFLFLLTIETCCAVTPITCVITQCNIGESSNVTCYFHQDMSVSKKDVLVRHYPTESTDADRGVDLLVCYWTRDSSKHHCNAKDGHQLIGNITDRLHLEIRSVASKNEGLYACHIVPPDNTVVHKCELAVKGLRKPQLRSEIPRSDSTPENQNNTALQTLKGDLEASRRTNAVLTSLLVVTFAGLGTLVVLHLIRYGYKRTFCRLFFKKQGTGSIEENDQSAAMMEYEVSRPSAVQVPEQRWPDFMYPEIVETSTQTEDELLDLLDEAIVALQSPDYNAPHTPVNTSPGNILDKFTNRKETSTLFTPKANASTKGNASVRKRTISHPPLHEESADLDSVPFEQTQEDQNVYYSSAYQGIRESDYFDDKDFEM